MKPKIPAFKTDEEAKAFVESANLAEFDLSGLRPVHFEFQPKAAQLNMRLPHTLLQAVKDSAKARGIPYTRFVRETLEQAVTGPTRKRN